MYLLNGFLVFCLLLFCPLDGFAKNYKWIDKNGKIHLSNQKPDEYIEKDVTEDEREDTKKDSRPSSPSNVTDRDGIYVGYANGVVRDTSTGLEWKVGPANSKDTTSSKETTNTKNIKAKASGICFTYNYKKTTGSWVWSGETVGTSRARYFDIIFGSKGYTIRILSRGGRGFAVRSRVEVASVPEKSSYSRPSSSSNVIKRDGVYVAYANGIVRDTKTGLEWKVGPNKDTDWNEARSWVQSLNLDSGGWRMPTMDELAGLYKIEAGIGNFAPLLIDVITLKRFMVQIYPVLTDEKFREGTVFKIKSLKIADGSGKDLNYKCNLPYIQLKCNLLESFCRFHWDMATDNNDLTTPHYPDNEVRFQIKIDNKKISSVNIDGEIIVKTVESTTDLYVPVNKIPVLDSSSAESGDPTNAKGYSSPELKKLKSCVTRCLYNNINAEIIYFTLPTSSMPNFVKMVIVDDDKKEVKNVINEYYWGFVFDKGFFSIGIKPSRFKELSNCKLKVTVADKLKEETFKFNIEKVPIEFQGH